MKKNSKVRIGIIGVGGMGSAHARSIQEGRIPGAVLSAVADRLPANLEPWKDVTQFSDALELIHSGKVDAVVIVTPHFSHAALGMEALKAGLHVLVEKPLTVRKSDAEELIAVSRKSKGIFAIMFNQRTDPRYRQLRKWIDEGGLGRLQRIQWTITDWFRPDAYYRMGSWRGTWAGEGGGILMNQAPHQLDLWQWLFGVPDRVRAIGGVGKHHDIEVEDDVSALFEYNSGVTGVFVTTTGEAPGVNRLEIAADKGLVILEGNTLRFLKNKIPTSQFSRTAKNPFSKPEVKEKVITFTGIGPQHTGILKNFVAAIARGVPLIAPGGEGLKSLEIANALVVSLFSGEPVELPMKSAKFNALLESLIQKGKSRKSKKS